MRVIPEAKRPAGERLPRVPRFGSPAGRVPEARLRPEGDEPRAPRSRQTIQPSTLPVPTEKPLGSELFNLGDKKRTVFKRYECAAQNEDNVLFLMIGSKLYQLNIGQASVFLLDEHLIVVTNASTPSKRKLRVDFHPLPTA